MLSYLPAVSGQAKHTKRQTRREVGAQSYGSAVKTSTDRQTTEDQSDFCGMFF